MTTRRDIIKGGAGLAAILATGKAPAYLVRSMLAARNGIIRGGGEEPPSPEPHGSKVEWLESTGSGEYIDTGIIPTSDMKMVIDAEIISATTANFNTGCNSTSPLCNMAIGGIYLQIQNPLATNFIFYLGNKTIASEYAKDTNRHVFTINFWDGETGSPYYGFDGNVFPVSGFVFNAPSQRIYVFRGSSSGSAGIMTSTGAMRIYGHNIYKSGVLFQDLVPYRVGSVGYMYDKVSGELFGNSGAGAFLIGPDASAQNGGGV